MEEKKRVVRFEVKLKLAKKEIADLHVGDLKSTIAIHPDKELMLVTLYQNQPRTTTSRSLCPSSALVVEDCSPPANWRHILTIPDSPT